MVTNPDVETQLSALGVRQLIYAVSNRLRNSHKYLRQRGSTACHNRRT